MYVQFCNEAKSCAYWLVNKILWYEIETFDFQSETRSRPRSSHETETFGNYVSRLFQDRDYIPAKSTPHFLIPTWENHTASPSFNDPPTDMCGMDSTTLHQLSTASIQLVNIKPWIQSVMHDTTATTTMTMTRSVAEKTQVSLYQVHHKISHLLLPPSEWSSI